MTGLPHIGVVGLGAMGLGIAQLFAQSGHHVIATDSYATTRNTAQNTLAAALNARVQVGKLTGSERDQILSRLVVVESIAGLSPSAMVVEAVVERLDVKQALFAGLEQHVSDDCVLATNTSSLSVSAIMQGLRVKGRGLGLHFFNPVPVMKLVELIAPSEADKAAVAFARNTTNAAGKTVITCADTPGFIVNRCARPFYGEALALLEEGRSATDIDAAMQSAGYRLGPLSLIDLVGADINLAATEALSAAMAHHPRYHVFQRLKAQVAIGALGRKSGKGFLFPEKPGAIPADAENIVVRIEAALANEAASLAAEGAVSPEAIDTAMKLGLNFPRGPFESTRQHGVAKIIAKLAELNSATPAHLNGRYTLAPYLETFT